MTTSPRILRNTRLSIFVGGIALLTIGCGTKNDPIIGKWKGANGERVEFTADGRWEFTIEGQTTPPLTCKWTKSAEGKLEIEMPATAEHGVIKKESTAVVDGDTLTTTEKSGRVVTYTRVK